MDEVRSGRLRLLYVAPERFVNERFCEMIQRTAISLFAVDEAHCISEWGHNFRPDYLRLARFAQLCRAERVLALTATATPQVLGDICRFFRIEPRLRRPHGLLSAQSRPARHAGHRRPARRAFLRRPGRSANRGRPSSTSPCNERPKNWPSGWSRPGWSARPYHAGMEDEQRRETQEWFIQSQQGIVVATIAFGMGIDKANIRYVYHYNPAKSLENYAQEVGRAGRDGKPATCEMFFCPDDLNVLENFAYGDTPTPAGRRGVGRRGLPPGRRFRRQHLRSFRTHDIRNTVVRTLLTYLELLGHIDAGTPFYAEYQFKPLVSSAEILRHFEGERKTFLQKLLAQAHKAQTWFHIDLDQACQAIGAPARPRGAGVGLPGRAELAGTEDRRRAAALSHAQPAERSERRWSSRSTTACCSENPAKSSGSGRLPNGSSRTLARWRRWGPISATRWIGPAGIAPGVAGRQAGEVAPAAESRRSIRPFGRRPAILRGQHGKELGQPRSLARFLCGVNSPWTLKAKLQTHPLFGVLAMCRSPRFWRRQVEA